MTSTAEGATATKKSCCGPECCADESAPSNAEITDKELKTEIKDAVNHQLKDGPVQNVIFTSYVLQ